MKPWHWWRTVFYLIPAVSVYTVVLGTASLLSSVFDRRGDFGHKCARAWSWLILKTSGVQVQVHGLEHLDLSRSYIVAANHQSIYDIPILFASLPLQLRIISKDSIGRVPFLGWHLQRTGHLLIDRSKSGAGTMKKLARLVRERHSLIIFPEGTRSIDGSVAKFKGGSFLIAVDAGLPVVPISIQGSRHVMFRGQLMVCPGAVTVTVHEPIETAGVPRNEVRDFSTRVQAVVASAAA